MANNKDAFNHKAKSADIRHRPACIIKKTEITDSRLKRIKDWATLYNETYNCLQNIILA